MGISLFLVLPIIAILFAIWFPFGFSLIGLIEEWDVLGLFSMHGVFFVADAGTPLAAHLIRPLTVFPQALAYSLDPNSFDYWHVLLILSLLIKACAFSHLMWKATGSLVWGVLIGLLVLLYPADTMQLSFRALHINFALSIFLFSSSIFIVSYHNSNKIVSFGFGALAGGLLFVSVCMYEAALVLVILPLLVILIKDGLALFIKGLIKNKLSILLWMTGAGAWLIHLLIVNAKSSSYQASLTGGSGILAILIGSFPKLFSVGLLRGLFGGWYDALRIVWLEYSSYSYLFFSVLVVGSIIFFALFAEKYRQVDDEAIPQKSIAFRLLFVGLLLTLLGYSPFLLSPAHQVISQRTFLWVAPGATMFSGAFLIFVAGRSKILAGLLSFGLIFIGLGAQVFQMHHYVQIGESQRTILKSIVENFDGNLEGRTLVVIDGSNQLGHTWMFLPNGLSLTLAYLYGHPISVEVCHSDAMEWQRADALGRKGRCVEGENDWVFSYPSAVEGPGYTPPPVPDSLHLLKSKAIVLKIKDDGSILADPLMETYRKKLFDGKGDLAKRYLGILAKKSRQVVPEMFVNSDIADIYRWNFGDWWSMELPIAGSGWREAEWHVHKIAHDSIAWKVQDEATLNFRFAPAEDDYVFHAQFPLIASDEVKKSMHIRLNESNLDYKWISPVVIEGAVKREVLQSGFNKLTIISNSDKKYYGLSAQMDWFDLSRK